MKLSALQLLTFAASTAGVSEQLINNYCESDFYLTILLDGNTNGPFLLPPGNAWVNNITGKGNTATVTNTTDVWSPVPKLVLGTTIDQGKLWW